MPKQPLLLVILDGWGLRHELQDNAAAQAHTPFLDDIFARYPWARLRASGPDVGLPEGQQGNSEVGHLNLGAGRIVDQDLVRIDKRVQDGSLKEVSAIQDLFNRIKDRQGRLHLLGLVSDGGVHSHQNHLYALMDAAQDAGIEETLVHAFLDGRDVGPKTGLSYIRSLEERMLEKNYGKLATVSGRYYAMDRDKRFDRVKKAWRTLVYGEGKGESDGVVGVQKSYDQDVTDEFLLPFPLVDEEGKPLGLMTSRDGILFFNFRADRARQLTAALGLKDFTGFERGHFEPLDIITLTEYDADFSPSIPVAFGPEPLPNTLGDWLATHGKKQIRIAETEKYAHVTFFFNGGLEVASPGESRVLIPSPKVATYDLQPAMHAEKVGDAVLEALEQKDYDFLLVNFANPDMVGHTGNLEAAIQALEAVDKELSRIVTKAKEVGAQILITADHGNCEQMTQKDGSPHTSHTTNPVPIIWLKAEDDRRTLQDGRLSDVAPSVLDLMGLEVPKEMTGQSLVVFREDNHE